MKRRHIPEDGSSNEKRKEPETKNKKTHPMIKHRKIKLQDELAGNINSITKPLFLRGKNQLSSKPEERRNNFLKECKKILNIGNDTRERTTTYQGPRPLNMKDDLPTHQYHQISFHSEEARIFYSKNQTY